VDKQRGSFDETTAKKVIALEGYRGWWLKKVVIFSGKNGVTPLVAAPGDTNLSDATVLESSRW